ADRVDVPFVRLDRSFDPAGDVRQVAGDPTDRVRLLVRLPSELVVRDAFEDAADAAHLLFELREQQRGDRHGGAPWGRGLRQRRQCTCAPALCKQLSLLASSYL